MKEYLKKFIFFITVSIVAAIIFRAAFPKTINVRIIGDVSTITGVSGIVNANVTGLINTQTKVKF
jgi:hypothetical protein